MDIEIKNLQRTIRINPAPLRRSLVKTLRHEGVRKAALSIVFVSDPQIRSLNRKHLKKNTATDVLAFDFREAPRKKKPRIINGEIIISVETAKTNSRIHRTTLSREIELYAIHGVLHLLGYDDHRASDIVRMRRKEKELLDYLAYP